MADEYDSASRVSRYDAASDKVVRSRRLRACRCASPANSRRCEGRHRPVRGDGGDGCAGAAAGSRPLWPTPRSRDVAG